MIVDLQPAPGHGGIEAKLQKNHQDGDEDAGHRQQVTALFMDKHSPGDECAHSTGL
jgi:hypothetical protein